ncbi:hypothetical protein HBI24_156460 [Parastagonospora nodorum]|nr:hypothetical protein HBH47_125380 [Parastagonospora nodorum]KAH4220859.1 hypothetical protein HBI06_170120 [Parastagonospora nodorum]KAH4237526.1 hypothetical protein HBI05_132560 [Parastagonospora nodorum]KAH4841295.1 hypothetical protein HBH75_227630 [Parastagonospora nodorum]KAH5053611.1 hypothetical protein HBH96_149080 [Parastagonospora nodorum]
MILETRHQMSLNKQQSKVDFSSCVAHRQLESMAVRDTSAGPSRSDPVLVSPECGSSPPHDILEGYMIAHKVPTRSQRPPSGTSFHKVGGGLSEKAPSFTITSPRYGVKEATVWKGPSFSYARLLTDRFFFRRRSARDRAPVVLRHISLYNFIGHFSVRLGWRACLACFSVACCCAIMVRLHISRLASSWLPD